MNSAAELLLQRKLKGPFECVLEPHQTSLRVLKDLQEMEKKNVSRAKDKQKRFYNASRRNVNNSRNDRVWMKAHPLSKASQQFAAKLSAKWIGPYRIVEKL